VSQGYQFLELQAVESAATRRHVREFAQRLFLDQLRIWNHRWAEGRDNKPRPPTREECIAKSRQLRRKREVESRYWNDLVSARPVH
jgi:hypothetical protein